MKVSDKERHLFPNFEILDVVEGGMARVYHLLHVKERTRAVAKTLRPEYVSSRRHYDRFLEEGRLAMSLDPHPMLIQPIAFPCEYGQPYLLMQWVDGWTLAEWSNRRSPLATSAPSKLRDRAWDHWWPQWLKSEDHPYHPAGLFFYTYQVCCALEFLYENGIHAHGDIHNNNIIVRRGPQAFAVLIDLGLAQSARVVEGDTLDLLPEQRRKEIAGCWPFLAPELFRGDVEPNPRTDIYSLGVTLYSALTGRLPYDVKFPLADLIALRSITAESLNNRGLIFPETVSARYQECVRRCISPRERERYASVLSLKQEIIAILEEDFRLKLQVQHQAMDKDQEENYDKLQLNKAAALSSRVPEKAIQVIQQVLSRHPHDEHTRRGLQIWADTLREARRFAEADSVIRRALAFGNPNFHVLNTHGLIQSGLERHDEAAQILRQAIAASDSDAERRVALTNLAYVLRRAGQVQGAQAVLAEAGTHDEDHRVLLSQAENEYKKENWNTAANLAQRVTKLARLEHEGWNVLGCSLYQVKQYKEAYEAFKQGLLLSPNHVEMLVLMAYAAAHSGHSKGEILALLDRAAALGRNDAEVLALRAAACTGEEARRYAKLALEEDPTQWLAQNVLASTTAKESNRTLGQVTIPSGRVRDLGNSVGLAEHQVLECVKAVMQLVTSALNSELAVPRQMLDEVLSGWNRAQVQAVCALLSQAMRADTAGTQATRVLAVLKKVSNQLNREHGH